MMSDDVLAAKQQALDFETLFNASPNPYMVLDSSLVYVAANDAYVQTVGRRREEILGRNLFDAFPGDPSDPAPTRMLRASFERVLKYRRPDTLALIPYAIQKETPEGPVLEHRYWSATQSPILNEHGEVAFILQHTVDVTELQQLKQALRQAEAALDAEGATAQMEQGVLRRAQAVQDENRVLHAERSQLRRLFQQAPGFIAVLEGPEHVFQMANASYGKLVGGREIIGKAAKDALPEVVDQGFITLLDQVYTTGEPFIGRAIPVFLRREPDAEPEEVFVDFVYQPVYEANGTVSGIFVEGHEVTALVRAQTELQELNTSLEERVAARTAELEARNRELQEFAYVASHDLQEPLRKVHSFADLMAEEYGDVVGENGRLYLDRMQAGVRRMSALIKDLLAYSRIATQARALERVDLSKVVAEAVGDLQFQISETGGRVEAGDLPEIEADPVQMRQLFQNLIGNAVKFHRPDVPPVVQISASFEEDEGRPLCRLQVRDNGIGFEARFSERVFVPFQRLHTRAQYDGTGIGLAICRRIAERHGGDIRVESVPGEGSTFVVRIPVRPD